MVNDEYSHIHIEEKLLIQVVRNSAVLFFNNFSFSNCLFLLIEAKVIFLLQLFKCCRTRVKTSIFKDLMLFEYLRSPALGF